MSEREREQVVKVNPEGEAEVDSASAQSATPPQRDHDLTFLTHLMSLKGAALMHLGVIPGAEDGLNLEAAHHLIEVIEALQYKSAPQLSEAEEKHISSDLYELKMAYIKAAKTSPR